MSSHPCQEILITAGGSLTSGSFTNNGTIHTTSGTSTIASDVQNNGGFQVDTGSGLLFLDDLSGDGPFTGGGEVTFQGGLNPGNSPGTIEFGGGVILDATSTTFVELAGLTDAEFDRLVLNNSDATLTIASGAGRCSIDRLIQSLLQPGICVRRRGWFECHGGHLQRLGRGTGRHGSPPSSPHGLVVIVAGNGRQPLKK